MNNNNLPHKNIFDTSYVNPEDVFVSEDRTQISIIRTTKLNDYCLYDMGTSEQATQWVNGKQGQVVFKNLNPNIQYAIRIRKADKDLKPEIHYIHTMPLFDDRHNK